MQVYSKQLGIVLQDFGACAGGRMFAAIDVDNSGFISLDELRGAMRAEDPSVTEAQVLERFQCTRLERRRPDFQGRVCGV